MYTFKSNEIYPINYSQLNWQPVKFFQNRRNVFVLSQSNNNLCSTVLNVLQLRNQMLGCTIQQRVAIVYFSGAPNDGSPLSTFKTLFRQSRVLLDLQKCSVVEFVSVRSSQGNLSLLEITRASELFSRNFYSSLHHIFDSKNFRYPFLNKKLPDLEGEM